MTTLQSQPVSTRRSLPYQHTALLAAVGILVAIVIIAGALFGWGTGLDGWRMATRLTARFSLFVFLVAFLAAPLAQIFASATTRLLVRERRGVGLAFAGASLFVCATLMLLLPRKARVLASN